MQKTTIVPQQTPTCHRYPKTLLVGRRPDFGLRCHWVHKATNKTLIRSLRVYIFFGSVYLAAGHILCNLECVSAASIYFRIYISSHYEIRTSNSTRDISLKPRPLLELSVSTGRCHHNFLPGGRSSLGGGIANQISRKLGTHHILCIAPK